MRHGFLQELRSLSSSPYNKDHSILGPTLRPDVYGNSPYVEPFESANDRSLGPSQQKVSFSF